MITKSIRAVVAAVIAVALGTSTAYAAADTIEAARDLYASAAYEDALAVLDRLQAAGQSGSNEEAVQQYRAFCLLALGRSTEAENAIAAVVAAEPLYHPADTVSPRIRAAFTDVRRRMLPGIIQQKYAAAKSAFDAKQFAQAADGFAQVLAVLGDPDVAPLASQPPLSDLRELATGFRQLSAAAAAPPPPPPAPPAVKAPPPPPRPDFAKIYDGSEGDVEPPVTVHQELPPFPGRLNGPMHGVLEVVINKTGGVESATMRVPVNGMYDSMALAATRSWKYRPAKLDGTPVRYRKIIRISLSAPEE